MKKCYCCGAKIEQDTAAFCPKCGKPLEVTAELTRRAAAGDSDAQTELYYRTYAAVYARIRAKVPDDDITMDLMQDTYLRAFSHLEQLNEPAAFPGWILTIARNLTINWYKKHSKEKTTALFSESEFENEANLSAEDDESASTEYRIDFMPEESLDRAETARLVSEILDELPEEQKIVLLMRYTDEMSIEEIAEELGISPNTVKTRLLRAKKKVEAKVQELERKGTKLYSLAPLPFLLFLLGNLENQAPNISATQVLGTGAAASASASAAAGTTATTTAATSAGTTAATTAAATAGGVATKGLAVKVIAALLAVALVGGGGAAAYSAYSQAKQAEEDARAAELLAEEEKAEEEAAALAEAERQAAEAVAEAEEEVVQVAPPTTATMEEMLGLFPCCVMDGCVTMTGTVTANQAIEISAFAIREEYRTLGADEYVFTFADGIMSKWSSSESYYSVDLEGAIVFPDDVAGMWESLPTEDLEAYLKNLFGDSFTLSDYTYSGRGFNYLMLDTDGQWYVGNFNYISSATTSIVNISNIASADGGFDVLAKYQSTEEAVTGERYVLYHVIPDEASDYGWVIVSMVETDETGTIIDITGEADPQTLEDVLAQYIAMMSGTLSYYDFIGAAGPRAYMEYIEGLDYFVECLSCFNSTSGYFELSQEYAAELKENSRFQYAFYDIDGDGTQELLIGTDYGYGVDVLAIWAMKDSTPVKVCESMYRVPLEVCNNGVILQYTAGGMYDHGYTFYSFNSLLDGTDEYLESYSISYDASIWDYTSYESIEDQFDWTPIPFSVQ